MLVLVLTGRDLASIGPAPLLSLSSEAPSGGDPGIISTGADLHRALQDAEGGVTLSLAPGNYGSFQLKATGDEARFAQPVTIRSADPCDPAVFTYFGMRGVSNVVLDGLHFENRGFFDGPAEDVLKPGDRLRNLYLLRTDDVFNITVRNSTFVGPTIAIPSGHRLNGYYHGFGWKGGDIRNATFTNNRVTNLYKGISLARGRALRISGNTITDYRSDAIYIFDSGAITITNNVLTNPRPYLLPDREGDHPDFIQLNKIDGGTIENNYLDIGLAGVRSQGIFAGPSNRMMVRNNIVATRSFNGIAFGALTNSVIANNLLVTASPPPGSGLPAGLSRGDIAVPRLMATARYDNVVISDNLAVRFSNQILPLSRQGKLRASGNVVLQNRDPAADNYYSYLAGSSDPQGVRIGNVWFSSTEGSAGPRPDSFAFVNDASPPDAGSCRLR